MLAGPANHPCPARVPDSQQHPPTSSDPSALLQEVRKAIRSTRHEKKLQDWEWTHPQLEPVLIQNATDKMPADQTCRPRPSRGSGSAQTHLDDVPQIQNGAMNVTPRGLGVNTIGRKATDSNGAMNVAPRARHKPTWTICHRFETVP